MAAIITPFQTAALNRRIRSADARLRCSLGWIPSSRVGKGNSLHQFADLRFQKLICHYQGLSQRRGRCRRKPRWLGRLRLQGDPALSLAGFRQSVPMGNRVLSVLGARCPSLWLAVSEFEFRSVRMFATVHIGMASPVPAFGRT
jgi:hypothetical protein